MRELAAAGVKRVSLSTTLYRAAMTGLMAAAREVKDTGTFGYVDAILRGDELGQYLKHQARGSAGA